MQDKTRIEKAVAGLDNTLREVLAIRNHMAKDLPGGSKMVLLKEVTREEYDESGQNPFFNFQTAVKEMAALKFEKELQVEEENKGYTPNKYLTRMTGNEYEEEEEEEVDNIPYISPGITLGRPKWVQPITSLAPPRKFTVKEAKKELEHYCDDKGIPTGKRGVFKPFIPGFTKATSHTDLMYRIFNAYGILCNQGVL